MSTRILNSCFFTPKILLSIFLFCATLISPLVYGVAAVPPTNEGQYEIVWDANHWISFYKGNGGGSLKEVDPYGVETRYPLDKGSSSYVFTKDRPGVYTYTLNISGQTGERHGRCTACDLTTSVTVVSPPPLLESISEVEKIDIPEHNHLVGVSTGEHSVEGDGSAGYSFPINIISGNAGMQPELAINYSSNGGNGALGMGWSVGGLSSIRRCGNDVTRSVGGFNTEERRVPDFTNGDNFCLNGNRLVLISGTHGRYDAEYRLENEIYSKIKITSANSYGPQEFKVWAKDGTIETYGGGLSSFKFKKPNGHSIPAVASWSLKRKQDRFGNYFDVEYTSPETGSYLISEIHYSGNLNTGLAPPNTVRFNYENREDATVSYTGGAVSKQNVRISSISNLSIDTVVRQYNFHYYAFNSTSGISYLSSYKECASNECLPATHFEYKNHLNSVHDYINGINGFNGLRSSGSKLTNMHTGDHNGDGFADIYAVFKHKIVIKYGSSSGSFTEETFRISNLSQTTYTRVADFNGDGLDDITNVINGQLYIIYATQSGFSNPVSVLRAETSDWGGEHRTFVGDFNADGRVDIVSINKIRGSDDAAAVYKFQKRDGGFEQKYVTLDHLGNSNWDKIWTGDFDGDGATDFARILTINSIAVYKGGKNEAETWKIRGQLIWGEPTYIKLGDFNGDGLTDIAGRSETDTIYVKYSTGDSFYGINQTITGSNAGDWGGAKWIWVADFNGDGLDDFASPYYSEMRMKFATANGFKAATWRVSNTWGEHPYTVLGDFNGNGSIDIASEASGTIHIKQGKPRSLLLSKVTTGKGVIDHEVKFEYKPLTDSSIYTVADDIPDDVDGKAKEGLSASVVVSRTLVANGKGDFIGTSYKYKGLLVHHLHGSLGFREMTEINDLNGFQTTTYTNQDTQLFNSKTRGLIEKIKTMTPQGVVISETVNDWDPLIIDPLSSKERISIRLAGTMTTKRSLDGALLSRLSSRNWEFNEYGDPIRIVTETLHDSTTGTIWFDNIVTKRQTFTYNAANEADWILPSVSRADTILSTSDSRSNRKAVFSSVEYNYDPNTGRKIEERVYSGTGLNSGDNNPRVLVNKTQYLDVNAYGDHQKVEVSGPDFETRASKTINEYHSSYAQIVKTTSIQPLEVYKTTQEFYNPGHQNSGLLNIATNINGFKTKHYYDIFGRNIKTTQFYDMPKAVSSYTAYQWCRDIYDGNYCQLADGYKPYYRIAKTADASPITFGYMDQLGREVRVEAQGPDGRFIHKLSLYNDDGRHYKTSEPFYLGDNIYYTTVEYDAAGRVISSTLPDGRVDTIVYEGLKRTSYMDSLGKNQTKTEYRNAADEVIQVTDNDGNHTYFEYDGASQLTHSYSVGVNDGKEVGPKITYDALGRKSQLDDPDLGLWKYTYNGLGQMITQENAKGEVTCFVYDLLGRNIFKHFNYTGSTPQELGTASDASDNCKNAAPFYKSGEVGGLATLYDDYNVGSKLGKPSVAVSAQDGDGYSEFFTYNEYGNLTKVSRWIEGAYVEVETTYDDFHRPSTVTYPGESNRLQVNNIYNNLGFNYRVTDSHGKVYYDVKEVDHLGNVTSMSLGNGVQTRKVFDPLTNRISNIHSFGPMRLTNDPDIQDLTFNFDKIGNLDYRNDELQQIAETSEYDDLNRLTDVSTTMGNKPASHANISYYDNGNIKTKTGVGTYTYGGNHCNTGNAGPHAVTQITDGKNTRYCYDANGNMIKGDGRDITYTGFDKPKRIKKGNVETYMLYDANMKLAKRVDTIDGKATTYIYLGAYEKVITPTETKERHYIGDSVVYTITGRTKTANGSVETQYLHKDHIGSITTITDSAGVIIEEFSFDAWGKRRAPNVPALEEILGRWSQLNTLERANLTIPSIILSSSVTNKGFTGHEQLDGVGLIHMGGRVYDPELGRFLSADPFIQDATFSQAYNRYSYVENNPLSYTDPSGYFLKKIFKKFVGALKSAYRKVVSSIKGHLRFLGRVLNAVPGLDTVIAVAVSIICVPCQPFIAMAMSMLQAGIAYANGAPIGQVLKGLAVGMATSAVSAGAAGKIAGGLKDALGKKLSGAVAGALVSGMTAKAHGGKFIDGVKGYAKGAAINAAATAIGTAIGNGINGAGESAAAVEPEASGSSCGNNPINLATGEKYFTMRDYEAKGHSQLKLERFYSSIDKAGSSLGAGWRTNFDKRMKLEGSVKDGYFRVTFIRERGDKIEFVLSDRSDVKWQSTTNGFETLTQTAVGWELALEDNTTELYSNDGLLQKIVTLGGYSQTLKYQDYRGEQRLVEVADSLGHSINFSYDYKNRLRAATVEGQLVAGYTYDSMGNLAKAITPDGAYKHYHYDDVRFNAAITSISNHNNQVIHSVAYDAAGRAIKSALGDDAERYDIVFSPQADGTMESAVTNSLGRITQYDFDRNNRPLAVDGEATASCIGANQAYSYDSNGLVTRKVDWNGTITEYDYNERGLETRRTEAVGTQQERTVVTQWHHTLRLPVIISTSNLQTLYQYNTQGLLVKRIQRDTQSAATGLTKLFKQNPERVWQYSYNVQGLLAAVDGPMAGPADTQRYIYNEQGFKTHSVNPLGHISRVLAFNDQGLPTRLLDANNVETALSYNSRGWLTQKVVKGPQGDEVTRHTYTGNSDYLGQGLVASTQLQSGEVLSYEYDTARRLVGLSNSAGERIAYTLDLEGNRLSETVFSESGDIVRTSKAVFDELGQLLQTLGADGQIIANYEYDEAGNQTAAYDALGRKTALAFDALNRLIATTDIDGKVAQHYDEHDRIVALTDQRGLTTKYRYNGFGDRVALISPDTGITEFKYDQAGLLVAKVDARNVTTEYRYDVLGRVTDVIYPAANDENIRYVYDTTGNAANDENNHLVGRLAGVYDPSGSTHYQYNHRGQVVRENYTIGNTAYAIAYDYNTAGQLLATHYPNGRKVNNNYSTAGKLTAVTTLGPQGAQSVIAHSFEHQAFGGLTGLHYGNRTQLQVNRDNNQRVSDIQLTTASNDLLYDVGYDFDAVNNITAITDALTPVYSQQFDYDHSYRLSQANGHYGNIAYRYDAVGNRLSKVHQRNAGPSEQLLTWQTYDYAQDSNRLLAVDIRSRDSERHGSKTQRSLAYDAVGNIVRDGQVNDHRALIYGANNRLAKVFRGAESVVASYRYNYKGQRVSKTVNGKTTHFHFNANKQLIAETTVQTTVNGHIAEPVRDYLYGAGLRLAVANYAPQKPVAIHYVLNDHLGKPALLVDNNQHIVWRMKATPFGDEVASNNLQPLRFPGQYADGETGYSYNYFRDYDPSLGRYLQSDPIGLMGGVNTYGYVGGNPLTYVDYFGLQSMFSVDYRNSVASRSPWNAKQISSYLTGSRQSISSAYGDLSSAAGAGALAFPVAAPILGPLSYGSGVLSALTSDNPLGALGLHIAGSGVQNKIKGLGSILDSVVELPKSPINPVDLAAEVGGKAFGEIAKSCPP